MWRLIFGIFGGLIVLVLVGLALVREDRQVNTEIVVDAPLAAVWQVLGDTARYPEWNPFIRSLTGETLAGGRIHVALHFAGPGPKEYDATLLGFIVDHEIRWEYELLIPGLFSGKHKLIIDSLDDGRTKLRHEEEVRGLLAGPVTASYLEQLQAGFQAMNRALKKRVEDGG